MLSKGPARKVTIYVNEDARHGMGSLYEAVLEYLRHKRIAGATATRGLAGFGSHQKMHTQNIELLTEHLPVRIEFIDTAVRVDEVLPTLYDMVTDGLIEVQETNVVRAASTDAPESVPGPAVRRAGTAKLLRVFLGEADQWHGEPLYDAIVKRLRLMEVAGATVYRGILGYGAKGHTHKQSFLHLSRDLPVMITVVDTPEKIGEAAAAIEGMLVDGLIVLSDVERIRIERESLDG